MSLLRQQLDELNRYTENSYYLERKRIGFYELHAKCGGWILSGNINRIKWFLTIFTKFAKFEKLPHLKST